MSCHRSRARRAGHGRHACAGLLMLLFVAFVLPPPVARAQEPNKAGLVIVHGNGQVLTRCVSFDEPQVSGYDLLRRSGLDLNAEISGMGATVCRLDNEGCDFPQQSCFCQCEGESCIYWSYWQWNNATWSYSNLGASNQVVLPGSVQGWRWGAGSSGLATAPPATSFDAICAPPTAAPTATATATPVPAATATATLTAASGATATATPTPLPAATATPLPSPATATLAAPPTWTPLPSVTPLPTWTPLPTATAMLLPTAVPVAVAALPTPAILYFALDRSSIEAGEAMQLAWQVQGAEQVHLEASGVAVPVAMEGSMLLAPQQNTTYLLVATSAGGANRAALTVAVRPKPAANGGQSAPVNVPPPVTLPPAIPQSPPVDAASPPPPALAEPATAAMVGSALSPTMAPTAPAPAEAAAVTVGSPTAAPGTAPVALAVVVTDAPVVVALPTSARLSPEADASGTLLLAVAGFLLLGGLPVGLAAAVFAAWLARRPRR